MGKAPEEKWGKMGENGGKWGKMGENGGKWGGNGEEMGGKGTGCTTQVSLISPISPHFPPFPPIFPHFPPFFLAMGTLWVRLWVQYPPPELGTFEPCKESILVSGPSFSFLETFGEKAGASVV